MAGKQWPHIGIGQKKGGAGTVYRRFDRKRGRNKKRFLTPFRLPNDDSVVVHKAIDQMAARSLIGRGDVAETDNSPIVRSCEGKILTNLWRCESAPGYFDSVDFAFGSLVFPTIKVFSVTSELFAAAIGPHQGPNQKEGAGRTSPVD